MSDTPDLIPAAVVAGLAILVGVITLIALHVTKDRRAESNTALAEALHGREDWPFWPSLIAEGTDSPEDRREGRPVCAECAQVMAGVAS